MKNIFTLALICLLFGKAGAQAVKPGLYVLSVGISKYKNSKYNLKYAHKDALDLAEVWRKQTDLYDVREVKTLVNEQATRSNIRAALADLKQKVSPSSFLVFIFSGHGLNDALVTYEFDNDDRTATTLNRSDLSQQLSALGGNYIALLDACHSGSFAKNFGNGGKDISEFQAEQDASMKRLLRALSAADKANIVIGSSSSGEKSDECTSCENGYFTQCLLDLFDGKSVQDGSRVIRPDLDGNGFVETNELDNYIKESVFITTRANQISQNVNSHQTIGYNFPIIRPANSKVTGRPATFTPIGDEAPRTGLDRPRESTGKSVALKITNLPNNKTKDSDKDGVPDVFDLCPDQLGELTSWGCINKSTQASRWSQQQNGVIPLGAVQIGSGRNGEPRYLVRVGSSLGYIEKDSLTAKVAIEGAIIASNVYDVLTKGRFSWVSHGSSSYYKYYYKTIAVNERSPEETIIRATYEEQVLPGKWRDSRKKSAAIQVGSAPEYKPKEFDILIDEDAPKPVYTPTPTEQAIWDRIGGGQAGSPIVQKPTNSSNNNQQDLRIEIASNWSIARGNRVWSTNKLYEMVLQDDGNLVIYRQGDGPIWAAGTYGKVVKNLIFQPDGNLVVYDINNRPVWATNTQGKGAGYMSLQNDGKLRIYRGSDSALLWSN